MSTLHNVCEHCGAMTPEKSEDMLEIEREIRAHNLHADAVLLRKQRSAWKRSRPKL